MILKPRYSLLTLLTLTALVAGGVKLWRGPHWRTLSDTRTTSDRLLLEQYSEMWDLQSLSNVVTDCQYRNTFSGPELLRVGGSRGSRNLTHYASFELSGSRKRPHVKVCFSKN